MVLSAVSIRRFAVALALVAPFAAAFSGRAEEAKVNLPLKDYLALVDAAEAAERARAERAARAEAPVAEVVAERATVTVGEDAARVATELTVLVVGEPAGAVALPLSGVAETVEVTPANGASVGPGAQPGELRLVAPTAGRYTVRLVSRVAVETDDGVRRLPLAPVMAPVAAADLDLPEGVRWRAPGAVAVEETARGGRLHVRLAARRGEARRIELERRLQSPEAEELLARAAVLTLIQLRPEGPRRHDVVAYEVVRGSLSRFAVELPLGLTVDQVGTEEGGVLPGLEGRRLAVERHHQLRGTGYLVLTSTPAAGGPLALDPVQPEVPVVARYVAFATALAGTATPEPAGRFTRIDLDDLPPGLAEAVAALDLSAAFRVNGEGGGTALAVRALPPAPRLPDVVRQRDTTTLVTVDGTLLHRDRFTLERLPGEAPAGVALELALPEGARLWSAQVDGQPVRPLEQGRSLLVPLDLAATGTATVEVVAVAEHTLPPGRSRLALELPRTATPVLDHRWRLLLPEGARYRFRGGDLTPARGATMREVEMPVGAKRGPGGSSGVRGHIVAEGQDLPGVTVTLSSPSLPAPLVVVTGNDGTYAIGDLPAGRYRVRAEIEGFMPAESGEVSIPARKAAQLDFTLSLAGVAETIEVTAEAPLLDARVISKSSSRADYLQGMEELNLNRGLVGGVKPLPITLPEEGKSLLLTGVLPPERVAVELDVKGR